MEFRNVGDRPPKGPEKAGTDSSTEAGGVVRGPEAAGPTRPLVRDDRQKLADRLRQAESHSSVRDELKDKLNHLDSGHPSSPLNADGTPRPPESRLSDYERPLPALSDADYKAHVEEVGRGLDTAAKAGLSSAELHTLNGDRVTWTPERQKIHAKIVADEYAKAADVPCDRQAIIAGGLGGAGKTTVLGQHAGIDRSKFLTINPDNFKEKLAEEGLIAEVPGLTPMETTVLAHDESSVIARRLAVLAMSEGKNIIWDITLSSKDSGFGRVQELRSTGYEHVKGVFVDIPIETSLARAEARHRRGHERYLDGHGFGGRYVPPEVIQRQADEDFGTVR